MRKPVAFLSEQQERGPGQGDWFWLGTFEAHVEGPGETFEAAGEAMSLPEALAWAHARTPRVWVIVEGNLRHWGGTGPAPRNLRHDGPLPDPLPVLERRRHPALAFLDRDDEDAPIPWAITAWIGAPLPADTSRGRPFTPDLSKAVAALAAACGADWDSTARDDWLRDSRGTGFAYGSDLYRVRLVVDASTRAQAREAALTRLALPPDLRAEDLWVVPDGWVAPWQGDQGF